MGQRGSRHTGLEGDRLHADHEASSCLPFESSSDELLRPAAAGRQGSSTPCSRQMMMRAQRSERSQRTHSDSSGMEEPFWLLIMDPPQCSFEVSDLNRYCWPEATPAEQRLVYRRMWRLLMDQGIARKLMDAMREESDGRHPMFLAGCVPYNYYLAHRFQAPAPIPTNDIDIKVDIGGFVRQQLAARRDAPTSADRATWSAAQTAAYQACMDEAIASFVVYATRLMERLRGVLVEALPAIEREFAPQGIEVCGSRQKVPQNGVCVHHKTHAAAKGNQPALHLVPLSGGVFQLMIELSAPCAGPGKGAHANRPCTFYWNVIDLEADWKTATVGGAPSPVEIAAEDDLSVPEHGLRLLSADACRADLNGRFQVLKYRRRELKKAYWDWSVRWHAEYGGVPNTQG